MKVQISIAQAIEVLRKNLNEHIVELEEAVEVWTDWVKAALDEYKAAVTKEGLKASFEKLQRLSYDRPEDCRPQYSKFLGLLKRAENSGQTTFEADEDDYDRIFNDNWDWRVQSKTSNMSYKK